MLYSVTRSGMGYMARVVKDDGGIETRFEISLATINKWLRELGIDPNPKPKEEPLEERKDNDDSSDAS